MLARLLALALLVGVIAGSSTVRAATDTAAAPERMFTPAEVRSDFAALYQGLQDAQFDIFAHTPKVDLDVAYAADMAGFDRPMSLFEVQTRFETFVARAKVAHARIDFPSKVYETYRTGGGVAFPFAVRVAGGRVFVAENGSGKNAIARGDEIVTMDGVPISIWVQRASRHMSADTPYLAGSLLEFQLPAMLWLELGPVASFELTLRKPDGRTLELKVPARARDDTRAAMSAQPAVFTLNGQKREARILPDGIGYLRPGPFYNPEPGGDMWDPTAFKIFIDASFQQFLDAKVSTVLIDLRENPGGDNSFSDPMVAWFATKPFRFFSHFLVKASPQAIASNQARLAAATGASDGGSRQLAALYALAKVGGVEDFELPWAQPRDGPRFTGRVYLLVNRHSYSNTVNVAALVQDFGFGTILGEETADMATTYGAMETFDLPITGIVVGFPKAHIIRPNGDPHSRGVVPDIAIAAPIVPATTDVVLDRALEIVRRGAK